MSLHRVLAEMMLEVCATRPHRISRVQHLNDDVRGVHHLVQLTPDAFRLSLLEEGALGGVEDAVVGADEVAVVDDASDDALRVRVSTGGCARGEGGEIVRRELGFLLSATGTEGLGEGGGAERVDAARDLLGVGEERRGSFFCLMMTV